MQNSLTAPTPSLHELFVTHRTSFINAAARILGCRSHAEDVVQEAFIKLESATARPPVRSQRSYTLRVVHNLAIDLYRRQALEKRYSGTEEEGAQIATPGGSPENTHADRETLERLSRALQELPQRTRYAFEMYRLQGRTQKDIALELGVSPTLVNFMIRDALVHCRKTLKHLDD